MKESNSKVQRVKEDSLNIEGERETNSKAQRVKEDSLNIEGERESKAQRVKRTV